MDELTALRLIDTLSSGIHPFSGQPLDATHLCQHPDLIRALSLAARALEERRSRFHRNRNIPVNAGKPWSEADTKALIEAFRSGKTFQEIGHQLKRTSSGVQARLERLGLVPATMLHWPSQAEQSEREQHPAVNV